jgi:hypothetical protein
MGTGAPFTWIARWLNVVRASVEQGMQISWAGIIVVVAAGLSTSTLAEPLTFEQWERLDLPAQRAYMQGVVDAFLAYTPDTDYAHRRYARCLAEHPITDGYVKSATNATKRGSWHHDTMAKNVIRYLANWICTKPV